jgi:hypothetical protein
MLLESIYVGLVLPPSLIDQLIGILRDGEQIGNDKALSALCSCKHHSALFCQIIELINTRNKELCRMAIKLAHCLKFSDLQHPIFLDNLAELIQHKNKLIRETAMEAMLAVEHAAMEHSILRDRIIDLLRDEKYSDKVIGVLEKSMGIVVYDFALGNHISTPEPIESDDHISTPRPFDRWTIVPTSIADILGSHSAFLKNVAILLQDKDLRRRQFAIRSSAALGVNALAHPGIIEKLLPLTQDENLEVRQDAIQAIRLLHGIRFFAIEGGIWNKLGSTLKSVKPPLRTNFSTTYQRIEGKSIKQMSGG